MTRTIWLPLVYEADLLRKGRYHDDCWLAEDLAIEIDEIRSPEAPVVLVADVSGGRIAWREHEGRLMRPILGADGDWLTDLDQLRHPDPNASIRTGNDEPIWHDNPFLLDGRFDPVERSKHRYTVHARADVEADERRPVREWLSDRRDARAAQMLSRSRGIVLIDGVPHRTAPEPVIRISLDAIYREATIKLVAPPILPENNRGLDASIYYRMAEIEEARAAAELMRTDDAVRLNAQQGGLAILDRIGDIEIVSEVPATLDPDELTIRQYASYNDQWLSTRALRDLPADILVSVAMARRACEQDRFDRSTMDAVLDSMVESVGERGGGIEQERQNIYGRLVQLQRQARGHAPAGPADALVDLPMP